MELEVELQNWASCFRNWTDTQRAYIEAFNTWLTKWLLHEQEETPDRFVPTIFIVSSDLHRALERISEVGVTSVMRVFADNVHELWETRDEERWQKLKTEYLSRDFSRRVRENGVIDALEDIRKILEEETSKHREIVRCVEEAACRSLHVGLVPIFEALTSYTTETVKAYEGLRIHP